MCLLTLVEDNKGNRNWRVPTPMYKGMRVTPEFYRYTCATENKR